MDMKTLHNNISKIKSITPELLSQLGQLIILMNTESIDNNKLSSSKELLSSISILQEFWCHKKYLSYIKNTSNKENSPTLYDNCMNLILVICSKASRSQSASERIIKNFQNHILSHHDCFNYLISMYRLYSTSENIRKSSKSMFLVKTLFTCYDKLYKSILPIEIETADAKEGSFLSFLNEKLRLSFSNMNTERLNSKKIDDESNSNFNEICKSTVNNQVELNINNIPILKIPSKQSLSKVYSKNQNILSYNSGLFLKSKQNHMTQHDVQRTDTIKKIYNLTNDLNNIQINSNSNAIRPTKTNKIGQNTSENENNSFKLKAKSNKVSKNMNIQNQNERKIRQIQLNSRQEKINLYENNMENITNTDLVSVVDDETGRIFELSNQRPIFEKLQAIAFQLGEICITSNLGEIISLKRDMDIEKYNNDMNLVEFKEKFDINYIKKLKATQFNYSSQRYKRKRSSSINRNSFNNFDCLSGSNTNKNLGSYGSISNKHIKFNLNKTSSHTKTSINKQVSSKFFDDHYKLRPSFEKNERRSKGKDLKSVEMNKSKEEDNEKEGKDDEKGKIIYNKNILSYIFDGISTNELENFQKESVESSIKEKQIKSISKLREIISNFIFKCLIEFDFYEVLSYEDENNIKLIMNYILLPSSEVLYKKIFTRQLDKYNHNEEIIYNQTVQMNYNQNQQQDLKSNTTNNSLFSIRNKIYFNEIISSFQIGTSVFVLPISNNQKMSCFHSSLLSNSLGFELIPNFKKEKHLNYESIYINMLEEERNPIKSILQIQPETEVLYKILDVISSSKSYCLSTLPYLKQVFLYKNKENLEMKSQNQNRQINYNDFILYNTYLNEVILSNYYSLLKKNNISTSHDKLIKNSFSNIENIFNNFSDDINQIANSSILINYIGKNLQLVTDYISRVFFNQQNNSFISTSQNDLQKYIIYIHFETVLKIKNLILSFYILQIKYIQPIAKMKYTNSTSVKLDKNEEYEAKLHQKGLSSDISGSNTGFRYKSNNNDNDNNISHSNAKNVNKNHDCAMKNNCLTCCKYKIKSENIKYLVYYEDFVNLIITFSQFIGLLSSIEISISNKNTSCDKFNISKLLNQCFFSSIELLEVFKSVVVYIFEYKEISRGVLFFYKDHGLYSNLNPNFQKRLSIIDKLNTNDPLYLINFLSEHEEIIKTNSFTLNQSQNYSKTLQNYRIASEMAIKMIDFFNKITDFYYFHLSKTELPLKLYDYTSKNENNHNQNHNDYSYTHYNTNELSSQEYLYWKNSLNYFFNVINSIIEPHSNHASSNSSVLSHIYEYILVNGSYVKYGLTTTAKKKFQSNTSNILVNINEINNEKEKEKEMNKTLKTEKTDCDFVLETKRINNQILNSLCTINYSVSSSILLMYQSIFKLTKHSNIIINKSSSLSFIRLNYMHFVRLYNKKLSFAIKVKLNQIDFSMSNEYQSKAIKTLLKDVNNDQLYVQMVIGYSRLHLKCLYQLAINKNEDISKNFKYLGVAELLFREISLESDIAERQFKYKSVFSKIKEEELKGKHDCEVESMKRNENKKTKEEVVSTKKEKEKGNVINKISLVPILKFSKVNEQVKLNDLRMNEEQKDIGNNNIEVLVNRTLSEKDIILNSNEQSKIFNSFNNQPQEEVELTNRNENILNESLLDEELEEYEDFDLVLPNEKKEKPAFNLNLKSYEEKSNQVFKLQVIEKKNEKHKETDVIKLVGNGNNTNTNININQAQFKNDFENEKVKKFHMIKKSLSSKNQLFINELNNELRMKERQGFSTLDVYSNRENDVKLLNLNEKNQNNNNLKIQIALEKLFRNKYRLVYEKRSVEFSENDILNTNIFYTKEKQSRLIYLDHELHSLVLALIFSLILNSKGTLEDMYCSSQPYLDNKTNILYILHQHLNHIDNQVIIPHLSSLLNEITPSSSGIRLLKLIVQSLFDLSLYKNWKFIAEGTYGVVYTVDSPIEYPKQLAVKKIQMGSNILDKCTLFDIYSEITALEKLRMDGCVIKIYDYGVDDKYYYIVMKKYKCSLKEWRESIENFIYKTLKLDSSNDDSKVSLSDENKNKNEKEYKIREYFFNLLLPIYLTIFKKIIFSIEKIHQHKITHYDLKCDNILVEYILNPCEMLKSKLKTENDIENNPEVNNRKAGFNTSIDYLNQLVSVKIGDFGESWIFSNNENEYYSLQKGTDVCKSPEMLLSCTEINLYDNENSLADDKKYSHSHINGEIIDEKEYKGTTRSSDIWSLGCLLYELLTGKFLFEDEIIEGYFGFLDKIKNLTVDELVNEKKKKRMFNNFYLIDFMKYMLVKDYNNRPNIVEVYNRFEHVYAIIASESFTNNILNSENSQYLLSNFNKRFDIRQVDQIKPEKSSKIHLFQTILSFIFYEEDDDLYSGNVKNKNDVFKCNKYSVETSIEFFLLKIMSKLVNDKENNENNINKDNKNSSIYVNNDNSQTRLPANSLNINKKYSPSFIKITTDLYICDLCFLEYNLQTIYDLGVSIIVTFTNQINVNISHIDKKFIIINILDYINTTEINNSLDEYPNNQTHFYNLVFFSIDILRYTKLLNGICLFIDDYNYHLINNNQQFNLNHIPNTSNISNNHTQTNVNSDDFYRNDHYLNHKIRSSLPKFFMRSIVMTCLSIYTNMPLYDCLTYINSKNPFLKLPNESLVYMSFFVNMTHILQNSIISNFPVLKCMCGACVFILKSRKRLVIHDKDNKTHNDNRNFTYKKYLNSELTPQSNDTFDDMNIYSCTCNGKLKYETSCPSNNCIEYIKFIKNTYRIEYKSLQWLFTNDNELVIGYSDDSSIVNNVFHKKILSLSRGNEENLIVHSIKEKKNKVYTRKPSTIINNEYQYQNTYNTYNTNSNAYTYTDNYNQQTFLENINFSDVIVLYKCKLCQVWMFAEKKTGKDLSIKSRSGQEAGLKEYYILMNNIFNSKYIRKFNENERMIRNYQLKDINFGEFLL